MRTEVQCSNKIQKEKRIRCEFIVIIVIYPYSFSVLRIVLYLGLFYHFAFAFLVHARTATYFSICGTYIVASNRILFGFIFIIFVVYVLLVLGGARVL